MQPDAIEEISLEVAEIEDQQLVPHPRAVAGRGGCRGDLNATRPRPTTFIMT